MRSLHRIGSFCLRSHNAHYAKSSPEAATPSACAGRTQPKSPHTLVVDSWEKYYLYSRIIRFPLSEISSFFIVISRILCTSSLSFDIPLIPFSARSLFSSIIFLYRASRSHFFKYTVSDTSYSHIHFCNIFYRNIDIYC